MMPDEFPIMPLFPSSWLSRPVLCVETLLCVSDCAPLSPPPVATSSALFQTHLSTPQAERLPPLYRHQVYHTLRITVQSKKTDFLCPGTPWAWPMMLGPHGRSNLAGKKKKTIKGNPPSGSKAHTARYPRLVEPLSAPDIQRRQKELSAICKAVRG